MKTWKIYKHTLLVGSHKGWSYVGLTSQNLKKRWRGGSGYKQEHQSIFYNAIQKHGGNNTWNTVWSHELLEDNIESLEKANVSEELCRKKYEELKNLISSESVSENWYSELNREYKEKVLKFLKEKMESEKEQLNQSVLDYFKK